MSTSSTSSRAAAASASKEINLSKDVFAGYKTTLRGGRVVFKEYHQLGKGRMTNLGEIHGFFAKLSQGAAGQLMSRDVYRITRLLPTERLVSVLCGGFGFYLMDALAMNFTFSLAYVFALLSVTGLLPFFKGSVVGFVSLTAWLLPSSRSCAPSPTSSWSSSSRAGGRRRSLAGASC